MVTGLYFALALFVLAVISITYIRLKAPRRSQALRESGRSRPIESTKAIEEVEPLPAPRDSEALSDEPPEVSQAPAPATRKRARGFLGESLAKFRSRRAVGEEFWEELEEVLLRCDVGLAVTTSLVAKVREDVQRGGVTDASEAIRFLQLEMERTFEGVDRSIALSDRAPSVLLFVGVNGVGKTTSIGKVAARFKAEGKTVVMAAGDTFRAAATEQLERWAERADVELVKGTPGGDPASVIYDAISHAAAISADIVLGDTAGRLQNRSNLMDELRKIRRVTEKANGTVTEVFLVLDATTGQNGLAQAKGFSEATGVTGVILTKLDGSAKGGVAFAIERELSIPIKLVGLGEGITDLEPFDPVRFVADITESDDVASGGV